MEIEKEKIVYYLPTSVNPEIFGPDYWFAFHDLASKVPCLECSKEAESFISFFHDLKNYQLGKKVQYKKNFMYWINYISKLKNQTLILK